MRYCVEDAFLVSLCRFLVALATFSVGAFAALTYRSDSEFLARPNNLYFVIGVTLEVIHIAMLL